MKSNSQTVTEKIQYSPIPTIQRFHESNSQIRCIVGPVGSAKTTGAAWEICYYIPHYMFEKYGIKQTRFVIVRNSYSELIDTTQKTIFEWFPFGVHLKQRQTYILKYPNGIEVELFFRSCDRPQDVKKFKQSLHGTHHRQGQLRALPLRKITQDFGSRLLKII
jgi:hypothetical protein